MNKSQVGPLDGPTAMHAATPPHAKPSIVDSGRGFWDMVDDKVYDETQATKSAKNSLEAQ